MRPIDDDSTRGRPFGLLNSNGPRLTAPFPGSRPRPRHAGWGRAPATTARSGPGAAAMTAFAACALFARIAGFGTDRPVVARICKVVLSLDRAGEGDRWACT